MRIGPYRVRTIVDADLALDGGSMFGVVPKPLWERTAPADERNRIALVSRLLYLEDEAAGRRVLVDTGLGDRWTDKLRDIYAIRSRDGGVVTQLGRLGVDPATITDVILTHLHFDHAAGTTQQVDDRLELTFPNAMHHVQRAHWDWAHSPTLKDAASFRHDDFAALATGDRLRLLEGDAAILPGIDTLVLHGHTRGMQAVRIAGAEGTLLFPADLVPTAAHVPWPFIMGYDNEPLVTLDEKQRHLGRAAAEGWIVVLEHDPQHAAIRLATGDDRLVVAETLALD